MKRWLFGGLAVVVLAVAGVAVWLNWPTTRGESTLGGDPDETVIEVTSRLDAILDRFVTVDDDFRVAHDNATHLVQT